MTIFRQHASADEPQLRAMSVGFDSGYRWSLGASGWGLVTWASRGVISVTVADALWVVPPQQALWLPPGVAHAVQMAGRGTLRQLYLADARCLTLPRVPRVVRVPPLLRELLRRVCAMGTLDVRDARQLRLFDMLLDELITLDVHPVELPMPTDDRARRAVEFLRTDPAASQDAEEIARRANASVRTLERLFRTQTGLSFGVWRRRARLVRAMTMLGDGATVTQAGIAAGYASTSAFVSAFRALAGVTPGRYRAGTRQQMGTHP